MLVRINPNEIYEMFFSDCHLHRIKCKTRSKLSSAACDFLQIIDKTIQIKWRFDVTRYTGPGIYKHQGARMIYGVTVPGTWNMNKTHAYLIAEFLDSGHGAGNTSRQVARDVHPDHKAKYSLLPLIIRLNN